MAVRRDTDEERLDGTMLRRAGFVSDCWGGGVLLELKRRGWHSVLGGTLS